MTMITGAHTIIYSTDPVADRSFFRDVLALPNIDLGDGWLVFALPPSEVAMHPSEKNNLHELYLTCEDVDALVAHLSAADVRCSPVEEEEWGRLTTVTLPGGGKLGIYQPLHEVIADT